MKCKDDEHTQVHTTLKGEQEQCKWWRGLSEKLFQHCDILIAASLGAVQHKCPKAGLPA